MQTYRTHHSASQESDPISLPLPNQIRTFQSLLDGVEQQQTDRFLSMITQQIMVGSNVYFQRTCADFLDDKYSTAAVDGDAELRKTTASVLKSNRLPESVFGQVPYLAI